jgi:tetratricopeptide (TPR) repeat protein
MATLQRAIELGPDYGRAYFNLGIVYMKLGVFDLALENLSLAIEHKGDPNAYVEAGWVSILIGEYEHAEKMFRASIDAGLLVFIAQYYLGMLRSIRGNKTAARRWFEKALESARALQKKEPENEDVLSFIALNRAACGNRGQALEIMEKLAISSPENGDVLRNIARCYAWLKDWDKAQEYIDLSLGRMSGYTAKEMAADPHFAKMPPAR